MERDLAEAQDILNREEQKHQVRENAQVARIFGIIYHWTWLERVKEQSIPVVATSKGCDSKMKASSNRVEFLEQTIAEIEKENWSID